jgi:hypothetical protein
LVFLLVFCLKSSKKPTGGDEKMIIEKSFIDDVTGELYGKNVRHIAAAFDEEKGYLFWARKSFSKSFMGVDFPVQMTMKERGQMATLAKKIWSTTNMLGYRGNGGVKPYSVEQIGQILGMKPYQANTFMRKMIHMGIIAKAVVRVGDRTDVQYYVNPIYFFSSNRIPLNLYLLFRKELDGILPEWVKRKYRSQSK